MQILSPDSPPNRWESVALAFLITEFYGNLSRNTDKAGALRQAMLEAMKKYPNHRDWAGFRLVGLL
jgi:CHAT domain-containing protein